MRKDKIWKELSPGTKRLLFKGNHETQEDEEDYDQEVDEESEEKYEEQNERG